MLRDTPFVKFAAKVATQSATAVLATLIGGYFLAMLNLRTPDAARAPEPAASEDRALTREYVKSLREGQREAAVEVRPVAPANETVIAKGSVSPPLADTPVPVARKDNRIKTEAAAAPGAPLPALRAPVVLAPAKVAEVDATDTRAPAAPVPRNDPTVFSVISGLIGTAANVTGDSINFVIDLPGRAFGRGRETRPQASDTPAPPRASQPVGEPSPLRFAGS